MSWCTDSCSLFCLFMKFPPIDSDSIRLCRPALCQRQVRSHQRRRASERAETDHRRWERPRRAVALLTLPAAPPFVFLRLFLGKLLSTRRRSFSTARSCCFMRKEVLLVLASAETAHVSVSSHSALFSAGVTVWHNKGLAVKFYSIPKNMRQTQFRLNFCLINLS